jgi:peroxiredoxin
MAVPGGGKLKRVAVAVLFFLLVVVFLTGCNEVKPTRIGETVPPFSLADLSGTLVATASGRGKTQVIYFWNDQCGCVEQLAQLRDFVTVRQASSLSFITVNVGQEKGIVESFVAKYDLPYTVLLDTDRKIATKHVGIKVLPTILVVDKSGTLREKLMGVVATKKLEEVISRYL